MAPRLVSFFNQPPFDLTRPDFGRHAAAVGASGGQRTRCRSCGSTSPTYRPAIRARRKHPGPDVISHLIGEGYTDPDILVECVTYGTAGMVTTREFICMAALHLMHHRPLRERYLVAEQPERFAILNEIIRLEPVVGHLYRRAQGQFRHHRR